MDLEEKKAYHQNYNKQYYLKKKMSKQTEGKTFFRKMTSLNERFLVKYSALLERTMSLKCNNRLINSLK